MATPPPMQLSGIAIPGDQGALRDKFDLPEGVDLPADFPSNPEELPAGSPFLRRAAGYPQIAVRMGKFPERMGFRRFGTLNAARMLRLQSELTELEENFREKQLSIEKSQQVHETPPNPNPEPVQWHELAEREERTREEEELWRLWLKIDAKLGVYNNALIQQHQIAQFPEFTGHDLKYVQRAAERAGLGDLCQIVGVTISAKRPNAPAFRSPDLVAIKGRHNQDPFSMFITERLLSWVFDRGWHKHREPSPISAETCYEDGRILRIVFVITTLLISQLPLLSIVLLNFVKPITVRLGIISGFAFLVALSLICFTNARQVEVFIVAAAFAGIQVIFIGADEE